MKRDKSALFYPCIKTYKNHDNFALFYFCIKTYKNHDKNGSFYINFYMKTYYKKIGQKFIINSIDY